MKSIENRVLFCCRRAHRAWPQNEVNAMTAKINFTVTIEDRPRKRLLGNWMSLNAAKDKSDLAQLKEAFSRRVQAMPGTRTGYGVCSDLRGNFDCRYWTAIEADPDSLIPNGMVDIILEAGPYACFKAPAGVSLADFYDYIRNSWEETQAVYMVDNHKPCFEIFGEDWGNSRGLQLFVPLKEKFRQFSLEEPLAATISA